MIKPFLLLLGLFLAAPLFSQSVSPEVTATAGDHFSGTNAQLSWTIGETMIETYNSASSQLSQGFHQTRLTITAVEDLASELQLKVFPNPTAERINIEWTNPVSGFYLVLSDLHSRQLLRQEASSPTLTQMDVSALAAGSYLLQVRNQDGKTVKTFKILKLK